MNQKNLLYSMTKEISESKNKGAKVPNEDFLWESTSTEVITKGRG